VSREHWHPKVGASRISQLGAGRFGSEVAGSREIQTPPPKEGLIKNQLHCKISYKKLYLLKMG